jgi:hypothetical protein
LFQVHVIDNIYDQPADVPVFKREGEQGTAGPARSHGPSARSCDPASAAFRPTGSSASKPLDGEIRVVGASLIPCYVVYRRARPDELSLHGRKA